jgi:hypothetical protein
MKLQNSIFYFNFWSRDIQHEWDIAFSTVFNAKKGLFISKWKFAKLNWFAAEYNSPFPTDLFRSIPEKKKNSKR